MSYSLDYNAPNLNFKVAGDLSLSGNLGPPGSTCAVNVTTKVVIRRKAGREVNQKVEIEMQKTFTVPETVPETVQEKIENTNGNAPEGSIAVSKNEVKPVTLTTE